MNTTTITDRIAGIITLPNGGAHRAITNTRARLSAEESGRYGHHLDRALAAVERSVALDRERKDPSDAMFAAGAREADRAHDAAAAALYKLVGVLADELGADVETRDVAAQLRALFFPRGLEAVVQRAFKDEAVSAMAILEAYESSTLQTRVERLPLVARYVDVFLGAARELIAIVTPQRVNKASYADVRAANRVANLHLREFAWHVAGTLTEGDADGVSGRDATRRDALLEPLLVEVEQQRAIYARRGSARAASVGAPGEGGVAAE